MDFNEHPENQSGMGYNYSDEIKRQIGIAKNALFGSMPDILSPGMTLAAAAVASISSTEANESVTELSNLLVDYKKDEISALMTGTTGPMMAAIIGELSACLSSRVTEAWKKTPQGSGGSAEDESDRATLEGFLSVWNVARLQTPAEIIAFWDGFTQAIMSGLIIKSLSVYDDKLSNREEDTFSKLLKDMRSTDNTEE